jgi:hypothetical protein
MRKRFRSAQTVAYRNGWAEEAFAHFEKADRTVRLSYEVVKAIAAKCQSRGEFKKKDHSAYTKARKSDWLDDICDHMEKGQLGRDITTKQQCLDEAKKYKTRTEFFNKAQPHYNKARINGWLDDVCAHMPKHVKAKKTAVVGRRYTLENVIEDLGVNYRHVEGYCVYLHRRKSDGSVFYVGKGTETRPFRISNRSDWWKRTAKKYGVIVEIFQQGMTDDAAKQLEIELISKYGRKQDGGCLINLTDGGDGVTNLPEETRKRIGKINSRKLKGHTQSEETIRRRVRSLKKTVERRRASYGSI